MIMPICAWECTDATRAVREIRSTSAHRTALIGAPEPMSIEAVLTDQIGRYMRCCDPLVDHAV
jgi:hypothetical protein